MTECWHIQKTVSKFVRTDWNWKNSPGQKMINKVASTIQVDYRLQCMLNCTMSPTCDSCNYRPSDKTWLLTSVTQNTSFVKMALYCALVLLKRRVSSTLTTLRSMPILLTSSSTTTGPGGAQTSATSSERHIANDSWVNGQRPLNSRLSNNTFARYCACPSFRSESCVPFLLLYLLWGL